MQSVKCGEPVWLWMPRDGRDEQRAYILADLGVDHKAELSINRQVK